MNGGPGLRGIDSLAGVHMREELNDSTGNIASDAGFVTQTVMVHGTKRDEMLAEMIGRPSGKMGFC